MKVFIVNSGYELYLRLEGPHPILAGLEYAPRIINGVRRVDAEATAKLPQNPITLIPSANMAAWSGFPGISTAHFGR